ncbi:MAG: glycosyltransferase [Acidipila sp.]|nr:glycosyltransferase [Acidipila sp.]
MKILQVVESLAPRYGGPSVACPAMCREFARCGHETAIYSTDADGGGRLDVPVNLPLDGPPIRGVRLHYFHAWSFPPLYKFSPPLAGALRKTASSFDVAHIYSLYGFPTAAAAHYCRKSGVPYVIHPHGSLDPFLRTHHALRKAAYSRCFLPTIFAGAAAVMFNSAEELKLSRDAPELAHLDDPAGNGPSSVIVDVGVEEIFFSGPSEGVRHEFREKYPEWRGRRLVTYFGRLNFKKGLDILVAAFCAVAREQNDLHLVLAGPDGDGYGEKIRRWLGDAGMLERATFTGNVAGAERVALLQGSAVMMLTSYTENFGQAVAEAMAAGVAVIISDRVNIWPEVERARAGLVVPCDDDAAAAALRKILESPEAAREMGRRGRELALARFPWSAVGRQILAVYEKMIERSSRRRGMATSRVAASV